MSGSNSLGDGRPTMCEECGKPVRIISRLPYTDNIDLCPIHMEKYLKGEASEELYHPDPVVEVEWDTEDGA